MQQQQIYTPHRLREGMKKKRYTKSGNDKVISYIDNRNTCLTWWKWEIVQSYKENKIHNKAFFRNCVLSLIHINKSAQFPK